MTRNILLSISVVLVVSSYASAFFWSSSDQSTPPSHYYYHKRLFQGPVYTIAEPERRRIPAVPVQVPLQAQLAPVPNIQNVQLVPCLCPVSPDGSYDNQQPQENFYLTPSAPVPVQQQSYQQTQK